MKRIMLCLLTVGCCFAFFSCGKRGSAMPVSSQSGSGGAYEIFCMVDSEKEAIEVAEGYGVTFVSFTNGIALFSTDIPFEELVQKTEELSLPPISRNQIFKEL